jgi:hypothetical protein
MKGGVVVGYTGWFGGTTPANNCTIIEIDGDRILVELMGDGRQGWIDAKDFVPMYFKGAGQEKLYNLNKEAEKNGEEL